MMTMTIAGTIANKRVIKRLIHGLSLMFRKPSMIIWPARVAVIVEFWPDASRAMAKNVLARPTPKRGVSKLYASSISAMSLYPVV